jgi:DNA replicative helicase MCM subunit Mcm2 (Cdc46/Mcm family)
VEGFFEKISKNNPMEYLSKLICPHLVGTGWHNVRKATLMLLVTHESNVNQRIRLHILLRGRAGTGKTVFLSHMKDNLQGIMINAELTSKTGLVGDARGKSISSGLLHSYDGNIVGIDELDKMDVKDQNGLLQAMEEGSYMIVKGLHRERFNAEIRAIASINDITKIMKPLRDRFDFQFDCVMSTRRERAGQTRQIVDSFFKKQEEELSKVLRAYLLWVDGFKPDVQDEEEYDEAVNRLANYIRKTETKIDEMSYRNLELSVCRIAWALAKLHKRNIFADDVTEAYLFKDHLLKDTSIAEYVFYKGVNILKIAKLLAEEEYGERFTTLNKKEKDTVLGKRRDLLEKAKGLYVQQMANEFSELEKMRKELTKSNAFDDYIKMKEKEQLLKETEETEKNDTNTGLKLETIVKEKEKKDEDVIYNVKRTDKPLTKEEAEKLSNFFTVKDLHSIFGNYGNKTRAEIIQEMSIKEIIPEAPIRKYICKDCGARVMIDYYCSPYTSPWGYRLCERCWSEMNKSELPQPKSLPNSNKF